LSAIFVLHKTVKAAGMKAVALTAENPVGFVAALDTTFVAAIVLCVVGVFTSALRGAAKLA
jgi:hypothetical protein